MNILAACGGPDSPVRKVVFKSSAHYYGCERDDPAFFTEAMRRPHPPRDAAWRATSSRPRGAVAGFAERNPDVTVTVLRFCNALGPDLRTSHTALFSLPAIPCILGFDPRYQFIHEEDLVERAAARRARATCPGSTTRPATACSRCRRSPLLGKPLRRSCRRGAPRSGRGPLRRLGLRVPEEVLNQLRYGRGLDNRKLKGAGYNFGFTSRETVAQARARHLRVRGLRAARASRTATSARSRSSCAGARASAAGKPP